MQRRKKMKSRILGSLLIILAVISLGGKSYGQFGEKENGLLVSSNIIPVSEVEKKAEAAENAVDFYLKTPVTLYFKDGKMIKGYLLSAVSEDANIIFVEVNGKSKSFNLDDVSKFTLDAALFDSFGRRANNDIKARIDNFVRSLQNDPGARGVIIYYTGADGKEAYVASKEKVINKYFGERGFDRSRVTGIRGGDCGGMQIQLWIVPAGATTPTPGC